MLVLSLFKYSPRCRFFWYVIFFGMSFFWYVVFWYVFFLICLFFGMSFFYMSFFWYVVFFVYIKKDMPTFSWFLTAMEVTSHYQKHTTSVDVQHVVFRHASVSSTYPCPSLRLLVRPLVTLSDFQSLVASSEKWKLKSERWKVKSEK